MYGKLFRNLIAGLLAAALAASPAESMSLSLSDAVNAESGTADAESTRDEIPKDVQESQDDTPETMAGFLSAVFTYTDTDGNPAEDKAMSVRLKNDGAFSAADTVSFAKADANTLADAENKIQQILPDGFSTADAYEITIYSENGTEKEPGGKTSVTMYLPETLVQSLAETDLYHVPKNGGAEKLEFTYYVPDAGSTVPENVPYITFETESFSPFVFVIPAQADEQKEGTDNQKNNGEPDDTDVSETKPSTNLQDEEESDGNSDSLNTGDESSGNGDNISETGNDTSNGTDVGEDKTATGNGEGNTNGSSGQENPSAGASTPTPSPEPENNVYVRSLSTRLFYGASKKDDGTYMWTAPSSASGHRFGFRISFSLSGVGYANAGTVQIRIPKSILKNRNGQYSDITDWSIPSKSDVDSATKTDDNGNTYIDPEEIDEDISYMYYEDGDAYVITNFRQVPAGDNGYIELAYATAESTFSYVDMAEQEPFTCSIAVNDGADGDDAHPKTMTADPITVKINTTAQITSTAKQYPYKGKIKAWSSSWGTAVKPENSSDYYYLEWTIRSDISATQPYDFSIDDAITGNYDGMEVLGYRYAGESSYTAAHTVHSQTATGTRYDYVLTTIPVSGDNSYLTHDLWIANNTETAKVTPCDKIDAETEKSASQRWTWRKPVYTEPTGHFWAEKRGLKTRYDLEAFNGFDEDAADHYNAENIKYTEYGNFNYNSWMQMYPIPWTSDTTADDYNEKEPWTAFGHKPARMQLVDWGFYLLNDDDALLSSNGSGNRTIENGQIMDDSSKAVALTYEDYYINRIGFSWTMQDASYDSEETGEWETRSATYTPGDVIVFEGKFGGSDEWVKFASYDIYNGKADPVSEYVQSMTKDSIIMAEGVNLTSFRTTVANAHYYTMVDTQPYVTLKNSEKVLNLLKGSRRMLLVNNNTGTSYSLNDGVDYKNADIETLMADDNSWTLLTTALHSAADSAVASEKHSSLRKKTISASNNVKKKYYTITWKILESETITTGENAVTSYLPQDAGIFYDLLPEGATYSPDSVQVTAGTSSYVPNIEESRTGRTLGADAYEVKTISNYNNTGRTMLVVKIKESAYWYTVTYDTRHAWNAIKDYGTDVYNPVAYETGNESITGGYPDNGGTQKADGTENKNPIKDADKMSGLEDCTGVGFGSPEDNRFLFSEDRWDISALTSATSGLTKKVKAEEDRAYSTDTGTHINGVYSYELRFMNPEDSSAKDMVFFDSLENYDSGTMTDAGTESDWHGTLTSIDLSQLEEKGIAPVAYISTKEKLDPETDHDVSDTSVWTKVEDGTDLSGAKAVAIDMRKKTDGTDFVLTTGDSVVAYLYMKAPDTAPDAKDGASYPYACNNVYISDSVFDPKDATVQGETYLIHQDFTRISLTVSGDFTLRKTSEKTGETIAGVTFRVYGTSAYGTDVDETYVTDNNGQFSVTALEKGTYTVQETETTNDFLPDATEHTLVIDGQGHAIFDGTDVTAESSGTATVTNKPRIHADITFRKVDAMYNATAVPGAVYQLSGTSDYGRDILMTAESGEDGTVTFANVDKGSGYVLKEISSPEGYTLDDSEYHVTVDADGNFTIEKPVRETFSTDPVDFDYTGSAQTYTAPSDGTYMLEVWGAQGGYRSNASNGGRGGYSSGTVTLKKGDVLYVYAGGSGNTGGAAGGFNGGGKRATYNGGGGASDIRIGSDSLYARVIVAGGGGSDGSSSKGGGAGGGTTGQNTTASSYGTGGYGATQTGNSGGSSYVVSSQPSSTSSQAGTYAGFGFGGNGVYRSNGYGGAGGGGWYGGAGTYPDGSGDDDKGGGGGSGYIYTASTASNYPSGCLLTSDYYLADGAATYAGTTSFVSPSGANETGHAGNGYARITPIALEPGETHYENADQSNGTYILKDEPLHYFTFTKKSSYDKAAVSGASFTLTGTDDDGNTVNMTAVSENVTGTVRFAGLASGTYALREAEAPEGYEADANAHVVRINADGTYAISGLAKEDGIYSLFDRKIPDKEITVVKVWDDGETATTTNGTRSHTKEVTGDDGPTTVEQDPDKLSITIDTDVPDAANRTYTVIYHGNGGTF